MTARGVSEKTKHRVRAVMEEYHYTPNVFARGLGLNSMQTIGIICPDVADSLYGVSSSAFFGEKRSVNTVMTVFYMPAVISRKRRKQAIELILKKKDRCPCQGWVDLCRR